MTEPPVGTSQESDPADSEQAGWATVASRHRPVTAKPATTTRHVPPPVRIKGSCNDGSLKSVPCKQVLAAYVGRLYPETSEELTTYMTGEGIKGVVCKKLKAKDGRKFNTAAFYVTCCTESRDKFYDDHCWPAGVELCDWVYYDKQ